MLVSQPSRRAPHVHSTHVALCPCCPWCARRAGPFCCRPPCRWRARGLAPCGPAAECSCQRMWISLSLLVGARTASGTCGWRHVVRRLCCPRSSSLRLARGTASRLPFSGRVASHGALVTDRSRCRPLVPRGLFRFLTVVLWTVWQLMGQFGAWPAPPNLFGPGSCAPAVVSLSISPSPTMVQA